MKDLWLRMKELWHEFATWFATSTDYYCRACRREGNSFVEKQDCTRHPEDQR